MIIHVSFCTTYGKCGMWVRELVEAGVNQLLFLPKYSPDLNEIKHDFSALKRARIYSPINTSIHGIIRNYCTKQCFILILNNYKCVTVIIVG